MEYIKVKCSSCGREEDRTIAQPNMKCFECKKKYMKEWHEGRKNKPTLIPDFASAN